MIIRCALTVVFGALPATWLSFFATLGATYGLVLVFASLTAADLELLACSFTMLVWGSLGIYGTISLWAVGFGRHALRWRRGLWAGMAAILPLIVGNLLIGEFDLPAIAVSLPALVACLRLIELHGRPRPPISDDEFDERLAELESRGISW